MTAARTDSSSGPIAPRDQEVFGHTALRGLAALSVVGYHAVLASNGKADPSWVAGYFQHAYLFVDLFFMLSGFIMVESYGSRIYRIPGLSDAWQGIASFWKRRALKILPNYYIWLGVAIAIYLARTTFFEPTPSTQNCLPEAVFLHVMLVQNLIGTCLYFNTPLWSIAVEMVAYALFPALLLGMRFWPALLGLALAFYGGLMMRYGTFDLIDSGPSVLRCLAGFIAGMSAVALLRWWPDRALSLVQLPVLIGMALCVASGWEAAAMGLLFLLVLTTGRNIGPVVALLKPRLIYLLGRASFAIYLAHIPVLGVLLILAHKAEAETGLALGSDWRLFAPVNLIVSAVIGVWAFKAIELRLERRLRR